MDLAADLGIDSLVLHCEANYPDLVSTFLPPIGETEYRRGVSGLVADELTGEYVRNACAAGYRGIYQDGRYPSEDFLSALNPEFKDFVSAKVEHGIGQLGDTHGYSR
jgi:hypothetical protein